MADAKQKKHPPVAAAPVTEAPARQPEKPQGTRLIASPLAKRLAAENNIDLTLIKGSGPHGRIVLADINALVEGGAPVTAAAPAQTAPAARQVADGSASTLIENSPMRMVIAERLQQSMQDAPHFFVSMDICIDPLLEARKALNAAAPKGVKISVNDMIIKAAAMTLMRHPEVNSSWEGKHTRQHHHADIAVAVAIENGLVTPIVRGAEAKGLNAISDEMKDLAGRACNGRLKADEISGGSFTISNLGPYGVSAFTAVINPPHAAILAIAAGEERPVVRNGEITVATMMTATLSVITVLWMAPRVPNGWPGSRRLSKTLCWHWPEGDLMADTSFDIVVIGGGPGGYVAAIRARQLGLSVAVVERENMGGICLNWGCIPTKALLRTAEVHHLISNAGDFGLSVGDVSFDLGKVIKRSRDVAGRLSGGVSHLMKKNGITVMMASARLGQRSADGREVILDNGDVVTGKSIILATGARAAICQVSKPMARRSSPTVMP